MKTPPKNFRLGIDLGATSLGWCMVELNEVKEALSVIDMGVRIFPDGRDDKSKEPLSVSRRAYRGQRRNLDRYLERMKALISYFLTNSLLPADQQMLDSIFQVDPLQLRARALDEKLSPAEISRALIHLARRRGFRSNRKVLSDKTTKLSEAIANLRHRLSESGARTLGEYLWLERCKTPAGAAHLNRPSKFRYESNDSDPNPIFPTREMVLDEFNHIWDAQARFNPELTDSHKQSVSKLIFDQRPLKTPVKGSCQLLPEYKRAPKAHPLFQEFRILQDLNNLRASNVFTGEPVLLDDDQHVRLFEMLAHKAEVKFKAMRKLLWGKQADDYRFNLETNDRDKLLGDQTSVIMTTKTKAETAKWWQQLDSHTQEDLISLMIAGLDDEPFMVEVSALGASKEIAEDLMDIHLPPDYCHLSLEALSRILPHMRKRLMFSDACKAEGLSHSGEYDGTVFNEGDLPYYGELLARETIELNRPTGDPQADKWGRINNPTVHIALNQLRKLVNALCKRYGPPAEIVLELGKELKLGQKEKEKLNRQANINKRLNEKIDEFLASMSLDSTPTNRLKTKLWWEIAQEETDRRCVYTGRQISARELFGPSIEIDHILPKTRTYDDGNSNKILCFREANRYKKEHSPWEAFGDSRDGYEWEAILRRVQNLPDNKKWRFQKDAMDRFADKEELISRMLNDTRYMSRAAMKYMYYVCGDSKVWSITGRHTSLLRSKWGLNSDLGETDSKDRSDHRHHVIDAFVTALTTRSMVKGLADSIEGSLDRFIEKVPPPWEGFSHEDFKSRLNAVLVSYKPDQPKPSQLSSRGQTAGPLVEDTAYGFLCVDPKNPHYGIYTKRVFVEGLSSKDIERVIAPELRASLQAVSEPCGQDTKLLKSRLAEWGKTHNVKKIRLMYRATLKTKIPVRDKQGNPYKYYDSGGNLFADIYQKDPTDPNCIWEMEIVSNYEAHQPGFVPQWKKLYPKGRKIMRLYKNDIVAFTNADGERELRRVRKMTGNMIYLRELNVSKKEQGKGDLGETISPALLMTKKANKAGVDIMGRVFDPGTGKANANSGDR